jgi:hypothetical protein
VKKKVTITLAVVLILVISFIYVTTSSLSQLKNENVLFLYLDETKGDPGTVEVASLAVFKNGILTTLTPVNPLESTNTLKNEGIFLSDCLTKAKSVSQSIDYARAIAEYQTTTSIHRVVLIDSTALKNIIDSYHPVLIDIDIKTTVLDNPVTVHTRTPVSGNAAQQCIRGEAYPGITDQTLLSAPEDYLWEVKSAIINEVTTTLFDFSQHTSQENTSLAYTAVSQYRQKLITVHSRNTILLMVYYLPESISKRIVGFAVRRIP